MLAENQNSVQKLDSQLAIIHNFSKVKQKMILWIQEKSALFQRKSALFQRWLW